jgi:hypothetical protein
VEFWRKEKITAGNNFRRGAGGAGTGLTLGGGAGLVAGLYFRGPHKGTRSARSSDSLRWTRLVLGLLNPR